MPSLLREDPLVRLLAGATLVNKFGSGVFLAVSALFFTRVVGLPVLQVGLGMTIAGGCGVLVGVPAGKAADYFGAKRVFVVLTCAEALCVALFPFVDSFGTFLPLMCLVQLAERANSAVRGALIAVALPAAHRSAARAYLRAVTNVGMGVGAAVGAIALQIDTRPAYVTMILIDAATYLITAAIMSRLPNQYTERDERPGPDLPRVRASKDRPYLVITLLNAVLSIQFAVLDIGVPLWVVNHTQAPKFAVSGVLLINTVLVVIAQVPVTRGLDTIPTAARGMRRGGLLLAAGCLCFGMADGQSLVPAVLLLAVAAVLHTGGEVVSSAAGWTLSYDLADPRAPGLYQGIFNSGMAAGQMAGPLVVTSTAIDFGLGGWVILGAVFAIAGAAAKTAATRAVRPQSVPAPGSLVEPHTEPRSEPQAKPVDLSSAKLVR